jgi:energy-converting hydrogenase Eha subunit C
VQMILTMVAFSMLMGWMFVGISMGTWLLEPIVAIVFCLALAGCLTEYQRWRNKRS